MGVLVCFGISVWFPNQLTKWFSSVLKSIAVEEGVLKAS